jgi:hypothetical protein
LQSNSIDLHDEQQTGDEDILDAAAVHTLLNSGTVYVLEPDEVPTDNPAAAILRYQADM